MADQTSTPTTSPIGSTPIPGKYTSEKLFLKLNTSEFNNHENDINNNGQIAFVDDDDSSFIYAQGIKVGGIKVEDLNLSNYATKNYVSSAIGALDASYTAQSGKYISSISQVDGKITNVTHGTLPATPTLSSLGGITSSAVDTKISSAIGALDASYTASPGKYISSISQVDGKITNVTHGDLPKTVSVNGSQNSITVNGIKYTLGISNGVLSISEDIPVTFSSFSVSPTTLATSGSDINRGTDYVGKDYSGGTIKKTVNDTNITLTASVNNPQGKSFAYEFKNESGTVIHSGTSTDTTSVSCTVKQRDYFNDGNSVTVANGKFTWDGVTQSSTITCKSNKSTSGDGVANETFSCKIAGTTKTAKVTGGQKCSFTAKGKVLIAYATSSNTNLTTKDITSTEYTTIKTIKVNSGITCTIYVPTCLNISPVITIAGVNVIPTSFKKETKSLTINNCTTQYHVYTKLDGPEGGEGYEYSISFS